MEELPFEEVMMDYNYQQKLTEILDSYGSSHSFRDVEILLMTLWKVNRYPDMDSISKCLPELNKLADCKTLVEAKSKAIDVLQILLNAKGVRLPMASTYLRFRNPHVFQIFDQRVWRQVCSHYKMDEKKYYPQMRNGKLIDLYFDYLTKLREMAEKENVQFEIADRYFYLDDRRKGNTVKY